MSKRTVEHVVRITVDDATHKIMREIIGRVVRCKDCVAYGCCESNMPPNGYCSNGEAKPL